LDPENNVVGAFPKTSRAIGWDLILIPPQALVTGLLLGLVGWIIVRSALGDSPRLEPHNRFFIEGCVFASNLVAVVLLLRLLKRTPESFLAGISFAPAQECVLAILAGIGLTFAVVIARGLLTGTHLSNSDKDVGHLVAVFLSNALMAPFAEELYFRGGVLGWLGRRLPINATMFVATVLFSLLHLSNLFAPGAGWVGFVTIFILGWVNARWAVKTGSLWPGICAHASHNAALVLYFFAA
jgi:membrane protease YdiL (CAAX protease family)